MAITFSRDEIPLGDLSGRRRSIVRIPAQELADKPGIIAYEAVSDGGVRTNYYTWFDSNGAFRYHTSVPTNQDSDGSTVTAGASTALSNLASVAINTTLVSDTSNTDDIGTDTIPWRTGYFRTSIVFDNATRNLILTASEPATAARTVNFGDPGGDDSVAYIAATQTITNKTLDVDSNTVSNINANELDPIAGNTFGVPFVVKYSLSNQAAAVNIFNANAPFKFLVIRAWSVATSADGGTWKLNNGAAGAGTDITNAVAVATSDEDFDEPSDYGSVANRTIASSGSLSIVPDVAGLLDCEIYVEAIRVD